MRKSKFDLRHFLLSSLQYIILGIGAIIILLLIYTKISDNINGYDDEPEVHCDEKTVVSVDNKGVEHKHTLRTCVYDD